MKSPYRKPNHQGIAETTKVDADYPENKLSGAVFEIYADVDNNGEFDPDIDQLVGEMTETEPGLYQMKDLVYGNYFLHEKESAGIFPARRKLLSLLHHGKRRHCAGGSNRSWRGLPQPSADRFPEGGKDSRR